VAIRKPVIHVRYGYRDNSRPTLGELVKKMLSGAHPEMANLPDIGVARKI
jgi:hypothetical protein